MKSKKVIFLISLCIAPTFGNSAIVLCKDYVESKWYTITDTNAIRKVENICDNTFRCLCFNKSLMHLYFIVGNTLIKKYEIQTDCDTCSNSSKKKSYEEIIEANDNWNEVFVYEVLGDYNNFSKYLNSQKIAGCRIFYPIVHDYLTKVNYAFSDPDTLPYRILKGNRDKETRIKFIQLRENHISRFGKEVIGHFKMRYPSCLQTNYFNRQGSKRTKDGDFVFKQSEVEAFFPINFPCEPISNDSTLKKYGTITCTKADTLSFYLYSENKELRRIKKEMAYESIFAIKRIDIR